ncbi:MAG: hypothetical protein JKY94_00580 [Rhodobacteraceae bacterium]|nr:hypothetical protein [Paracoccaceae bacterium]
MAIVVMIGVQAPRIVVMTDMRATPSAGVVGTLALVLAMAIAAMTGTPAVVTKVAGAIQGTATEVIADQLTVPVAIIGQVIDMVVIIAGNTVGTARTIAAISV